MYLNKTVFTYAKYGKSMVGFSLVFLTTAQKYGHDIYRHTHTHTHTHTERERGREKGREGEKHHYLQTWTTEHNMQFS